MYRTFVEYISLLLRMILVWIDCTQGRKENVEKILWCIPWEGQRVQGGRQGGAKCLASMNNYLLKTLYKRDGFTRSWTRQELLISFCWREFVRVKCSLGRGQEGQMAHLRRSWGSTTTYIPPVYMSSPSIL